MGYFAGRDKWGYSPLMRWKQRENGLGAAARGLPAGSRVTQYQTSGEWRFAGGEEFLCPRCRRRTRVGVKRLATLAREASAAGTAEILI